MAYEAMASRQAPRRRRKTSLSWTESSQPSVQPVRRGYDAAYYTIYRMGRHHAGIGRRPTGCAGIAPSTAALKICEMRNMGGQSIQYAPLSMIETLQEAAVQQMQQQVSPGRHPRSSHPAAGRPGTAPGRIPHAGPGADPGRFGKSAAIWTGTFCPSPKSGPMS